jgi:hypothetical protein
MRLLVTLACCLALLSAVQAQQEDKSKQKKQTQTAQHAAKPASHPGAVGVANKRTPMAATGGQKPTTGRTSTAYQPHTGSQKAKSQTSTTTYRGQNGKSVHTSKAAYQTPKGKRNQIQAERQTAKAANAGQVNGAGKSNQAKTPTTAGHNAVKGKFAQGKPVTPQHFNLANQPNTAKAPPVTFQRGKHIQGSQNWHGQQYTVFRNYSSQWHDQNWWHNHFRNNIVFVFGAPYYWSAGYWFPAWGYYPNAYYAWDGPIYAYNRLPPDQVIANVQETLQQQGYYQGEVDGLIGPLTRNAIADYQRDHGLYMTSTIDQPTLESLGMT